MRTKRLPVLLFPVGLTLMLLAAPPRSWTATLAGWLGVSGDLCAGVLFGCGLGLAILGLVALRAARSKARAG